MENVRDKGPSPTRAQRAAAWQRVRRIFEAVYDLPTAVREERIEALCEGCGDLAGRVRDLVASHFELEDRGTGPLDLPIVDWAADRRDSEPGRAEVDRLGPYVLERIVGRGGMGTVWKGRRDDGELRLDVAIKLLRTDIASPRLAERLRRERQILADLRHPDIARFYDGGTTADGRPYLVMEWAPGESLSADLVSDWPLERRLRLFLRVCETVAHAHCQGVVHRDLKPANILVREADAPILLDFGIATVVRPLAEPHALTETGASPMTLRYASPEQVGAAATGPASDVYSLGVLFYELLAGQSPYGPQSSPLEWVRAIGDGDIRPPSRSPGPFTRELRGALDAIAMRALATAPSDRYGTAGALAEDLRRYLRGQSPLALRHPWPRLQRFVRRRRQPLLAAGLASLALAGSIGALAWQQQRLDTERQLADTAAMGLGRAGSLLVAEGDPGAAEPLFEQEVELWRARDRAEPLARALGRLGDLALETGDFDGAAARYEQSVRVLEAAGLEHHPQRARSLTAWGLASSRSGELVIGERRLRQGLRLLEIPAAGAGGGSGSGLDRLEGPARGAMALRDQAIGLAHYGRALIERSAYREARGVLYRAIDLARRGFGDSSPQVAAVRFDAAMAAAGQSRFGDAERLQEQAGATARRLPPGHPTRLRALERQAHGALLDARADRAETLARELSTRASALGSETPLGHDAGRLLCQVLREQGRATDAVDACAAVMESARALYGPDHPRFGDAIVFWAEAMASRDRPKAMAALYDALDVYQRSVGDGHPMVARIRHYLSLGHWVAGEVELATRLHEEAVEAYRAALGPAHPDLAYCHFQFGNLAASSGHMEQGLAAHRRAVEVLEQGLGEDHPRLAWLLARLSLQLTLDGQGEAAEAPARRALTLAGGVDGVRGGPDAAAILVHLGVAGAELEAEWYRFGSSQPGEGGEPSPICLRMARLQDQLGEGRAADEWRHRCQPATSSHAGEPKRG